ncbi:MAG TPA: DUF354 domain-containing protein [Candidatus Kapabacteria bacterium]|nr:DUF354 domain-containing protein [Candidatus Kapabacteria bacterium]
MHREHIGIPEAASTLYSWAKEHDFAGHDPHDLLNAPLLARTKSSLARLVAVQLGRRSLIDFRTILRVPDTENPKAIALWILGLLAAKLPNWQAEAVTLGDRLVKSMSQGGGWGYPFPWQSRTHFLPKFTPNIVTTSFAGNALMALHSAQPSNKYADAIHRAAQYIVNRIPQVKRNGIAFGYAEADPQIVFNASLLGAEFLLNAGEILGEHSYIELAKRAAQFAASYQKPDGSWPYGLERSQTWIDSFHTGFAIVSMKRIAESLNDAALLASAARGFAYYRNTFIEPDYAVKYFSNRRYPIDAHALGQAMVTLCTFGDQAAAERVAEWAIANMRSPDGYFYYQRHRLFTNRIAYMRWSNAWMFRGLTEVLGAGVSGIGFRVSDMKNPASKGKASISKPETRNPIPGLTIWIDLENTPHVPFFLPIISGLEQEGFAVILTARDFAQTKALTQRAHLNAKIIGGEYGNSAIRKTIGIASRALRLAWYLKEKNVALAVGHGSRGLLLASKLLRIPSLTLYDYEGASVALFNRWSTWVMTPEIIPFTTLERLGLKKEKHLTYPGLKEEVYLGGFMPDEKIIAELGLDIRKIIITIRPPSSTAHYRSRESFALFRNIMQLLTRRSDVQIILLPRNAKQREEMQPIWGSERGVIIPAQALDGINLLYYSDLVIGGGGTMNREAAAMGVPVISMFKGAEGAVDRWLVEQGRMIAIAAAEEVIPHLTKRSRTYVDLSGSPKQTIMNAISRLVQEGKK